MKLLIKIWLLLLLPSFLHAQSSNLDSIRSVLNSHANDSTRFRAAIYLNVNYQELNRDTALYYAEQLISISNHAKNNIGIGVGLTCKAYQLIGLGHYADALKYLQRALAIAENVDNEKQEQWRFFPSAYRGNQRLVLLSFVHFNYGFLMMTTGSLDEAVTHLKLSMDIAKKIQYTGRYIIGLGGLGEVYNKKNEPDSAIHYLKNEEKEIYAVDSVSFVFARQFLSSFYLHLGNSYAALGNDSLSLSSYYQSIYWSLQKKTTTILSRDYLKLGQYYIQKKNKDSALYYALNNYAILQTLGNVTSDETNPGLGYKNLYLAYELNHQFDSAYKYQTLALTTIDSLDKVKIKNLADFQTLSYNEQFKLQKLEQEKEQTQSRILAYSLVIGLAIFLLIGLIIYRNSLQRKKANIVLQEQKTKVEITLHELKSTQQQLIQSEKMASLGELTAGIAHEIQNPLNFVNNFSEVNQELISELVEEVDKGNTKEVKAIANDIKDNEEKINHHGKRADSIVKGMLQHSRQTSGMKEPTDINALCDEYLRLSYHGLRAKDKNFNADFKTDFDDSIGNINIISQDISRVLLNLYNNAFYAVNEKQKTYKVSKDLIGLEAYEPAVSVSTKKVGNSVTITVSDNGNGIPLSIKDKIFQPFFTTKPTGQGTGLGLSLSYDIVKAHGGELKVETKEGEGTEFIILLPLN